MHPHFAFGEGETAEDQLITVQQPVGAPSAGIGKAVDILGEPAVSVLHYPICSGVFGGDRCFGVGFGDAILEQVERTGKFIGCHTAEKRTVIMFVFRIVAVIVACHYIQTQTVSTGFFDDTGKLFAQIVDPLMFHRAKDKVSSRTAIAGFVLTGSPHLGIFFAEKPMVIGSFQSHFGEGVEYQSALFGMDIFDLLPQSGQSAAGNIIIIVTAGGDVFSSQFKGGIKGIFFAVIPPESDLLQTPFFSLAHRFGIGVTLVDHIEVSALMGAGRHLMVVAVGVAGKVDEAILIPAGRSVPFFQEGFAEFAV